MNNSNCEPSYGCKRLGIAEDYKNDRPDLRANTHHFTCPNHSRNVGGSK